MNFTKNFFKNVEKNPEQPAIIYQDEVISYGELGERINQFGNGLKRLGVRPGDRIALMMNNRPEFVITYYAAIKLGTIIVPINTFLKSEELKYQLNNVEANVFVGNEWSAQQFSIIEADCPTVKHFIVSGKVEGRTSFDEFISGEPKELELREADDDDVAVIKYTSGTTGKPKGAMQTHKNIILFLEANMEAYELTLEDRPLLFVPLFHGFGDHCCMNLAFYAGTSFVLMDPFKPDEVLGAIERHKCTYFGATPSMLYVLMNWEDADKYDTSSLKRVLTGGGPVTKEVVEGFERSFGVPVLQGYGLAEGTAGYTYTRFDMPYKEGSCGIPLPGVEIRIVDDEGRDLPVGEAGEIVVRSGFNMKGYWKDPESTAETIVDGWLHTGDIGKLDEDGYLYILDRKKEMIIMSGENIYPSEIEDILMTHPAIAEAAVIGAPDPRRGEIPMAVIVTKPGAKLTEQEVIEFASERMASFKVPKKVAFRDSLPKGPTFKILKRELKKEYFGG